MSSTMIKEARSVKRLLSRATTSAVGVVFCAAAQAAEPGISGNPVTGVTGTFNLTAQPAYLNQPDGAAVYSWGYGCVTGSSPSFLPASLGDALSELKQAAPACSSMQVPGPTLIVTEGTTVIINLTNNLPNSAGSTSI